MPLQGEYAPSTSAWARTQAERYEASGGVEAPTLRDTGLPIIVLTTLGAKSGKLRKTALMRVEHEGRYAVVASKGGTPENPAWYHNLLAHPQIEIEAFEDGEIVTVPVTATEIGADEWEAAYAAIAAEEPQFGGYLEKTDRRIPVFQLTRRTA